MTSLSTEPASTPGRDGICTWLVTSPEAMAEIYAIRREVFVDEQGLTQNVRDDPDDRFGLHVMAAVDGAIAGTGRVTFYGDEAQIVWVAVRKPYRRRGVGHAIMDHLIRLSREHGARVVTLNAQTHALHFYESLGFEPIGRRFYMGHIEHQYMSLDLTRS